MAKITREEVLKLAELSKLEILDNEIDAIIQQLESVLSYAVRVTEIAGDISVGSTKNVNVFAPDIIQKTDYEPILAQSPEHDGNLFIVPKVLD